jgi:hypothetical protein
MKKSTIAEFERLYNINIPVHSEFEYYKNLLLKSKEYDYLPEAIARMEKYEKFIVGDVKDFKIKAMNQLIDYISKTEAYKSFQEYDLQSLPKFESKDKRSFHFTNNNTTNYFLSIDLVSANYSILQYFFDRKNELAYDWRELCAVQEIPLVFSHSKSFRQYVFGNLNPKRSQTIQQSVITGFVHKLGEIIDDDVQIIYVSHDEIMLSCSNSNSKHLAAQVIGNVLKSKLPIKYTFFTVDHVKNKSKIIVKNILDENDNLKYSSVFNVPGNEFFWYYKKYILKEPIEIRDLYFQVNNRLAIWASDPENESIDSTILDEVVNKL